MRSASYLFIPALIVMLILSPVPSLAADGAPGGALSYLDGLTLIVLDSHDIPSMQRARNTIQSFGGRVAIMSPPSIMLGWIPFEIRDDLVGRARIKDIYYTEVLPSELDIQDRQGQMMINYFNAVTSGKIQADYKIKQESAAAQNILPEIRPDALDPPPFEEKEYLENLENVGLNPSLLKDRGLLLRKTGQTAAGNSDKMSGTVSVTVFFVESDGTSSDPDLYTWTGQHMQDYINGVNNGMAFWTSQAQNYGDCWVAFMVHSYPGTDSRCQQWIEPVLHASTYQSNWVLNVISNFGYTSGSVFTRVNAFNTWQKSNYGTDWAYSAFVGYNPPPASDRFTDGYSAAAYLGGPYTYLLYRSFSWDPSEVFPHESGHIFHACDEYYQAGYGGCTSCGTCYNGVDNANCEYCGPGKPCMMLNSSFTLCQYTPGHVGWFYSPCAPGPLNPPVVSSSSPASQYQALGLVMNVGGTDFQYGAYIDLGPDITINSMTFNSSTSITADITVLNSAAAGMRDLIVYNRDLQSDTLFNAFEVLNTTVHYMSPTGGNVYPYITPADAASSLTDAIAVANDDDSVMVESVTFNNISLNVGHGIMIYGGWINNFTQRDLVSGKTVLNLNGNVNLSSTTSPVGIDGFIVENGTGTYSALPFNGYFGGGIKIVNCQAVVANCEIRSNAASSAVNFGVGGGIFAMNSTVDINNNYIWGNNADFGAGIYLYNSGGSIDNNMISSNLAVSSTTNPMGGGIYFDYSPSVTMSGNTIDHNSGAMNGGGLYVDHSGPISMTGGEISHNTSSSSGGGIYSKKGSLLLDSVKLLRNSAAIFGGAVTMEDTTTCTLSGCQVSWNGAILGAGIYASGGELYADHSLYVGNNSGNSGGGLYMSTLSAGSFIGNTMDRNTAAANGGGVMIATSGIDFVNNIIANSTNYGIYCSGPALPVVKYNDVWNNSTGDYFGIAPGEGAVSSDPMFADTALTDYHLAVHSPAIDAGDTSAVYNDPDGSRGDMGWMGSHAFVMDQPSYPKSLVYSIASGNIELKWNGNPEGDMQYYSVYRDTSAGFIPGVSNFIQFVPSADTTYTESFTANAYYKISAVDSSLYGSGYSNEINPVATGINGGPVAYKFRLFQNVPNPFNPATVIKYELDNRSFVTLTVFDVQGRLVKKLVGKQQSAGPHSITWFWR